MMRKLLRLALPVTLLCASLTAAEVHRLQIDPPEVRLTAGGSAPLPLATNDQGLPAKAVALHAESAPGGPYALTVGKRAAGQGLFLAAPPTMPPGAYRVKISFEDGTGRRYAAALTARVDPLPPIPQTGRPPVVLMNGFDFGSLFTGQCTLQEDTTGTFGRLEEFLEADGAPVVFFDNCRFGTPPLEVLGQELGNVISQLEHPDGSPVTEVDLVAFSMGALVARSYLAGKQIDPGVFLPPPDPKVRKMVLVAGEHFGTALARSASGGQQLPALQPASRFLWDLATWHQGFDDLREVDALALAGRAGRFSPGDGVAPLTSASLASAAFFGLEPERTRILPACHNGLARPLCTSGEVLMAVDAEDHPSARIIRSFLAGGDEWRQIGTSPVDDPTLATNGGIFLALQDAAGDFVADIGRVVASDPRDENALPDVTLEKGPGPIYFREVMPSLRYLFEFERPSGTLPYTGDVLPLGSTALLAKVGPAIARVQPAAGAVSTLSVAADSLVSIFGRELAASEQAARSLPLPTELAGARVAANGQPLGLLYAGPGQINAYLPAGLDGLVRLTVSNAAGEHSLRVLLAPAVPALFSLDGSGSGPAAALHASTLDLLTAANPATIGGGVALFATGLGATAESDDGLQVAVTTPEAWVGGLPARVLFAGLTGQFAGLYQINVEIPEGAPAGPAVPVVVRSGKRASNQVTLAIQ